MKPKWLIEKGIQRGDDPDALAEIVRAKGMECVRLEYIPFSNSFTVVENGKPKRIIASNMPFADGECVIVIGTLNICQLLMKPKRWTPTAWFNLPDFRCTTYYTRWKDMLLGSEHFFLTWKDLREDIDFYYERFGVDGCIFLKPNENLKMFSGSVVPKEKFEKWADMNQDCYEVPQDALCVIAKPVGIEQEWRFVISDRKVVASSLYKNSGKISYFEGSPPQAREIAEKVAALEWQPDSMYVVDVCHSGDGYYVLECGPFNGAGLYKCELEPIVEAASALALKEWEAEQRKEPEIKRGPKWQKERPAETGDWLWAVMWSCGCCVHSSGIAEIYEDDGTTAGLIYEASGKKWAARWGAINKPSDPETITHWARIDLPEKEE